MQVLIGVYWPARQEDITRATQRASAWFACLEALSPELSNWYKPGRKHVRDTDMINISDPSVLENQLRKGVNHKDMPREPIPELGWSVNLWNGQPERVTASVSFLVGSYSRHISNNAHVTLTDFPEGAFTPEICESLLQQMRTIWNAREGRVEINGMVVASFQPRSHAMAAIAAFFSRCFIKR